jgi:hypothetical protein
MENNHSLKLLTQAIIQLAEKTNSVQDLSIALSDVGLTHQDMSDLKMQFVVAHEYNNKANFMFLDNGEQATLLMQNWAAACKSECNALKCDKLVGKDHIALIYRVRPFKDELHVFSIVEF